MGKHSKKSAAPAQETQIKEFLDMISPGIIKFNVDHFLCGNTYRCVWALREYPTTTDEQAILRHLGEKDGVTLRIYTRMVTPSEEKTIIHNAANKHRMAGSNTNDLQQTVTAESNLQDVTALVSAMHRNREPLLHCAVYIELIAHEYDELKLLQTDVLTELVRSKLNVDRLLLRQQQGFLCVGPSGWNVFGAQFERVLPASSVANLYPFNYSGKTDTHGFYIGRDKSAVLLYKKNNTAAREMSQSIAELNAKLLMLEQLRAKGYLAPEVHQTQSRDINNQLAKLKKERQTELDSHIIQMLDDVKHLKTILEELEDPLERFDEKLFTEVVKAISIDHNDEMTLTMIGGLRFTELI